MGDQYVHVDDDTMCIEIRACPPPPPLSPPTHDNKTVHPPPTTHPPLTSPCTTHTLYTHPILHTAIATDQARLGLQAGAFDFIRHGVLCSAGMMDEFPFHKQVAASICHQLVTMFLREQRCVWCGCGVGVGVVWVWV